jgi:hypothetical protein
MRLFTLATAALLLSGVAAFAQTGMAPVYQELQRQGFSRMQTYREQNRIRVTAHRGGELRQLVYDGRTGALLWDSMDPDRDRTHDRIYLRTQDQLLLQDQDRDQDRLHDGSMDRDRDRDRTRDPTTH